MKKLLLISIFSLLTVLSFGLDFGGNLEDSTYISGDSSLYHADTLSLWISTEVWKDTELYVQGSYTYTTDEPYYFDLDYMKFENNSPSIFNYVLGRFSTSDFSGYIFSHKLDGFSGTFNFPGYMINAKAGYTGLLFNNSSSVNMSLADQSDSDDQDILFASPRLVGGVEVLFPELFSAHDLTAGLWAQFDLRKESDLTAEGTTTVSSIGGKLNSQYLGLSLSGPLVDSFYYDSFVYLGTGNTLSYIDGVYEYKPIISFLGSAGVRYYKEELLYSRIAFRFLFSSGDTDYASSFTEGNTEGNATNFTTISNKPLGLVFSPNLGNIIFTQLSYSLKPFSGMDKKMLKNIQLELMNVNFFRSGTGQISETGIDPASEALYLGTEIDGTVNFRPFSDLGLSLSAGVFIPNNGTDGAFLEAQRKVEFLSRLGLSFKF